MTKEKIVTISAIESATGTRYIVTDVATGIIIDNAQGYGFKTPEAAFRYATAKGWSVINHHFTPEANPLF